ncbi:Cgl0159 family (beta/alpha)8-fold protein [Leifsonia poae]|uniref:Cgl0159 family (beta/alpha)8-fold protein n=1 Tax=Leifsonia poae TaxID=110933 RepID=UPI001CBDA91F|nr:deoxyribose-phosphate aldolase [Leifsonia poae]
MSTVDGPISAADFQRLRRIRSEEPQRISEILETRAKRDLLAGDGRLFIVAADHPARGALGVGSDATAMADRYGLLQRLATALERPGVDGVLGTPDILDDLAILGRLDGRIAVGSMNRGGLRGASFEMDDRFTAYDVESLVAARLDFAKLLVRINLADPGSAATLEASAAAVTAAAAARLPIMLEPFMSDWVDGRIVNDLSTGAVIASMAIAAGLGTSSAYSWLKLPVVPNMAAVMSASTLPTLLLGGDPSGDAAAVYDSWGSALDLPGVMGLVVGRTLLYPSDRDVAGAVDTAASLVH